MLSAQFFFSANKVLLMHVKGRFVTLIVGSNNSNTIRFRLTISMEQLNQLENFRSHIH